MVVKCFWYACNPRCPVSATEERVTDSCFFSALRVGTGGSDIVVCYERLCFPP